MPPEDRLVRAAAAGFAPGWTAVVHESDAARAPGLDLGILRLTAGARCEERLEKESAWVLLHGRARVRYDGQRALVERRSLFDEAPTVLHLGPDTALSVESLGGGSEWAVARATNARPFAPRLFRPEAVRPEYRGAGLAQGACLRNVRLVFDAAVRPEANLVLGEVVNYPGRWSSWPPHHHPQPEIYHYRFTEPQGYGHAELGDRVFKVRHGDTLCIPAGATHAQAAAPGYGMWYLWVVRHLPGAPYRGFDYEPEHAWMLDPAQQGWEPPAAEAPA
jgi:5-deoxy-glucuronate isomerase